MRKSRFLALILTVVFVLANVTIPSFADNTAIDAADIFNMGALLAPVDGMPFHIAGVDSIDGNTNDAINLSNGILSIGHDVAEFNVDTRSADLSGVTVASTKADATSASNSLGTVFSSFNYGFEDGKLPATDGYVLMTGTTKRYIATNLAKVTEEGTGRVYGDNTGSYVRMFNKNTLLIGQNTAPFVFEMDILNARNNFGEELLSSRPLFYLSTSTTGGAFNADWLASLSAAGADVNPKASQFHSGGWHNYKWIITPVQYTAGGVTYAPRFDFYVDGQYVAKNVDYTGYSTSNKSFDLVCDGIDNFKRYGTSLGFAHDMVVNSDGTTTGSTLRPVAQHAEMPTSNIPEAVEYEYSVSDTADGTYTPIATGSSYTIDDAHAGKFIKVTARVRETISGGLASEPIYSEPIFVTAADVVLPDEPYANGDPADIFGLGKLVAPIDGKPFHISHKTNDPAAVYTLNANGAEGLSLSDDGILTIASDAAPFTTTYYKTTGASVTSTSAYGTKAQDIGTIFASFNFTFEDGTVFPDGAYVTTNSSTRPVIKNLDPVAAVDPVTGRKYGKKVADEGKNLTIYGDTAFLTRPASSVGVGTAPFVFEMEINNLRNDITFARSSTTYFSFIKTDATGHIRNDWITELTQAGASVNNNFDRTNFSGNGWHTYKWVITPSPYGTTQSHYDLYIDDKLFVADVPVSLPSSTSMQNTSTTGQCTASLYCDGVDNIKRYGSSLGFAYDVKLAADDNTVGTTLTYSAKIAKMPTSNIPEALECAIMVCDTLDGRYSVLETLPTINGSFIIPEEAKGKYIKVGARVKETVGDQCATLWVLSEEYVFVSDLEISIASVTVDGEACADNKIPADLVKDEAEIVLTINAKSASGKNAKFVFAQYNKFDDKLLLKSVARDNLALTSTAANYDLTINAKDVSADTEFKLFVLTTEGLIPLDLVNLK